MGKKKKFDPPYCPIGGGGGGGGGNFFFWGKIFQDFFFNILNIMGYTGIVLVLLLAHYKTILKWNTFDFHKKTPTYPRPPPPPIGPEVIGPHKGPAVYRYIQLQ